MNHNIKRLRDRATVKKQSYRVDPETFEPVPIEGQFYSFFDEELFTNLLIDEAAELLGEFYNERTQECAGVKIRDHFGVEENLSSWKATLAAVFDPNLR